MEKRVIGLLEHSEFSLSALSWEVRTANQINSFPLDSLFGTFSSKNTSIITEVNTLFSRENFPPILYLMRILGPKIM